MGSSNRGRSVAVKMAWKQLDRCSQVVKNEGEEIWRNSFSYSPSTKFCFVNGDCKNLTKLYSHFIML